MLDRQGAAKSAQIPTRKKTKKTAELRDITRAFLYLVFLRGQTPTVCQPCDQHHETRASKPDQGRNSIRYAFRLAGYCLNVHYTDNGSELFIASLARAGRSVSAARRAGSNTLSRTLLHARALLRIARRRPSLALGLAVAAGSALSAVGATEIVLSHRTEMRSAALAPAQLVPHIAPPTPPTAAVAKPHHHFLGLHSNPLRGLASWYGTVWNGRKTASGETFDETKLTAAHKTLPLGTLVRVTNLDSMRSVIVKINDRGTLAPNRVIDLSSAAAMELGMLQKGLANVKLEVLGRT